MGRELDERTIAAEAGLVARTVSFTKGCYTGQELVARLDARGNKVARRLCGVVIEPPADTDPDVVVEMLGGATLGASDAAGEPFKALGTLTSLARCPGLGSPRFLGALAYAHRSLEVPGAVMVQPADPATTPALAGRLVDLPMVAPARS